MLQLYIYTSLCNHELKGLFQPKLFYDSMMQIDFNASIFFTQC